MRRTILAAAFASLTGIAALALYLSGFAAQPVPAAAAAAQSSSTPLPVAQVILYSSGVGYFQREGTVEGNSRVDLTFPVQDINDLLKSMVLQDLDGGQVSAVSYDSQAPIAKTLKSFAIDLTRNPTFAQILNQARGERVEVALQAAAAGQPGTLTGSILGVERQKQTAAKEAIEVELLNLWCAEGIRSVKLAEVQRLRFLNPVMDSEVKRALEVLAISHDTQKKAVRLNFTGDGKRKVQVGYVVENPIWKTSYRLVLGKDGKPFLQGWAIVENPTDEDWNGVRMALISGRPISFQMDLYQPLYVPRPVVEPELFASLRPPTYNGNLVNGEVDKAKKVAKMAGEQEEEEEEEMAFEKKPARVGQIRLLKSGASMNHVPLSLQQGVTAAATASEMGDYFQYAIAQPVSLARQKSAMLPIVQQSVEARRVSIYNEAVQAKHPLLGLKFKNTTGLHLMQGPITVFEGSAYAGDARIMDLQPREERLLSYAIDLGTEVEPVGKDPAAQLIQVKAVKGILTTTTKTRDTKTYTIKNRSEHDRTVLVEHPYRPEFKLLAPKQPAERSRDVYRFEVKAAPGKSVHLEVVEERDVEQSMQLTNLDDDAVRIFVNSVVSSAALKLALKQVVDLKGKVALTQRELAQADRQLKDIVEDQTRLRANLKEMPPTAEAYKRYLKKFDDQETEIEKLQALIKKLQATEHQQRKDLDAYLASLTVE